MEGDVFSCLGCLIFWLVYLLMEPLPSQPWNMWPIRKIALKLAYINSVTVFRKISLIMRFNIPYIWPWYGNVAQSNVSATMPVGLFLIRWSTSHNNISVLTGKWSSHPIRHFYHVECARHWTVAVLTVNCDSYYFHWSKALWITEGTPDLILLIFSEALR